ncbi:MAG: hypothetical protein A2016_01975 [Elusimicrobia bacterium GWF2_62_30]|nr:MAG: hypothetical protein A2016_01975 [Elusimicrobia bacterium GWF2_62_30]
MHKSFELLSVADDAQLRDPARIRRIYLSANYGLYAAMLSCGAAGVGLAGLALWTLQYKMGGRPMPGEVFWSLLGVGAGGGLMCLGMACAFLKELRLNPLRAYLKDPASCLFSEGSINEAHYLSSGKRSSSHMSVSGTFGESGIFMDDFEPGVWSRAVAERGEEESLRPGDDRYPEKGKRQKLPLPVWVIARREDPRLGVLCGIPAKTVSKLV